MKCLLIETKDKRKFFTHEKNFVQLIEFSKTFNAEISVVRMKDGPILELEELAPAICSAMANKKIDTQYQIIKNKSTSEPKNRNESIKIAEKIQKYITKEFEERKIVSLKNLKIKFKKYELSDAALCNHIRRTKIKLEKQGKQIKKVAVGQYCMS